MNRDIVVIGASAGGVEALKTLVADLPADLPAAVFVVVHLPPKGSSVLSLILDSAGPLPAQAARDGMPIEHGRIYVAPPDFHMLLHPGVIHLSRGPRENLSRPSVDALFRSAARAYGSRVIGLVLTGLLDDGTAGLAAVKRQGGIAVVQDPETAQFPSMPQSALDFVDVDHCMPLDKLGGLISQLSRTPPGRARPEAADDALENEVAELSDRPFEDAEYALLGVPAGYSCPTCHGALWSVQDGEMERYRCRVGHAFSVESLYAAQEDEVESALWAAVRALEENVSLAERMSVGARRRRDDSSTQRFHERARELRRYATVLRRLIARPALAKAEDL